MSFKSLGISHYSLQTIKELGYSQPFPIQEKAIPIIMSGKDLMGIAQTGSGKTACFVIPILEKLQNESVSRDRNIQVLVLVPTRELAVQIDEIFRIFARNLRREIRTMAVYGGVAINPQMKAMLGVEILVATPGRLLELLDSKALSISQIQQLVVDEADKMFQLGFEEEMNQLISLMPKSRQTILFSATLNDKVAEMKSRLAINPQIVEIKDEDLDLDQIEQIAYQVDAAKKGPFLRYLIKENKMSKVLIFVSSQRTADNLVEKLKKNKINAIAIHGKKTQAERTSSLVDFKSGKASVLIATDLLGRGIHIDELPVVINFELPRSPLDYIHRIGRTGRANESGKAITLLTTDELPHFKLIQKKMGKNVIINNTDDVNLQGF